mmetsp:Transcript_22633/g.34597  ORF Transcript_22633/g.34597 Transcript_22633/m.34597 type:complete len:216 (-) Transcript_22633:472-1119(-)
MCKPTEIGCWQLRYSTRVFSFPIGSVVLDRTTEYSRHFNVFIEYRFHIHLQQFFHPIPNYGLTKYPRTGCMYRINFRRCVSIRSSSFVWKTFPQPSLSSSSSSSPNIFNGIIIFTITFETQHYSKHLNSLSYEFIQKKLSLSFVFGVGNKLRLHCLSIENIDQNILFDKNIFRNDLYGFFEFVQFLRTGFSLLHSVERKANVSNQHGLDSCDFNV